ncbi:MAG: heme lyase CcmF/NrfE family subunit [Acidimicrobiales bacterium]|nr:heme lyase CcmF/NrfE family subunit [Acidimicrobiales bacterium]
MVTVAHGLVRRRRNQATLMVPYAVLGLAGAVLAFAAMERALIQRDFTIRFVAEHGSHKTPLLFEITALWSGLQGSILLWGLVLAGYIAVIVWRFRDRRSDPLLGWAVVTMFAVATFFFGLMLGPANPFVRFSPPLGFDGQGPNPLLQNHPLMAFHPPLLYLGYVGFTVPFAFAIGALVTGRVGEGWLVATRRWTLFAWGFLTAGIVLGAWWSYEVLGWAGYWAWDPVENASFLPWLTGTAYLHSVMIQERRGMLRVWNLSLLCATFSLTILGTFLTRSGVIQSVHAFSEGSIGPLLLGFFAVIVLVSVGLIGWRGDRLRSPGRIDSPLSREGAFLLNNVLFAAFAFVVLLGTVFPLIVEALQDRRVSVGPQYFNRMSMPIGFVLLFLMAIAPVLPWRKASGELLSQRLLWPAWAAVAVVAVAAAVGARGFVPFIAFALGGFAGGAALRQVVLATRRQGWRGLVGRANGGMIVHLGVVLIAVGMAASSAYLRDSEFSLAPGQSATLGDHTVTYLGLQTVERSEKRSYVAAVQIDGGPIYEPSINLFRSTGQSVGEPSVRSSWKDDVYLTLEQQLPGDDGVAVIRVIVQPLVVWLWIGGALMALGTVLAAFPGRRRRRPTDPVSAPADAPPASDRGRVPAEVAG